MKTSLAEPAVFPATRPWSESARDVVGFVGINAIGLGYILALLPESFGAQGDRALPLGLASAFMGAVALALAAGFVPPRHARPLVLGGTAVLLAVSATLLVVLPGSARSQAMSASMAFAALAVLALALRPDLIRRTTPVETLAVTQFIGMGLVSQLIIGPSDIAVPLAAGFAATLIACGIGLLVLPRGRIRSAATALSIATLLVLGAVMIGVGAVPGAFVVLTLAGVVARDAYRLDLAASFAALALVTGIFEVLSWVSASTGLRLPAAPWASASTVTDALAAAAAASLILFGRRLGWRACTAIVVLLLAAIMLDVATQPADERVEHVFTAILLSVAAVSLLLQQRGDPRAILTASPAGGVIVMLGVLDLLERGLGLSDVHLVALGDVHASVGVAWALAGLAMAISAWSDIRARSIRLRSVGALVSFVSSFAVLMAVIDSITQYVGHPSDPSRAPQIAEARRMVTGLLLVYLAALSWLAIACIRAISGPLDALTSVLRAYASGDRSARVEISGDDEITAVARAFNAVADDLARSERLRAMASARFRERVLHDELTGLGTISLLREAVDGLIDAGREVRFTLLMCEVPRVEDVVAVFGQEVGDAVIVELSRRLRAIARSEDTLARTSAFRFGLLAPGLSASEGLALAEAVRTALERPVAVRGHEFSGPASVGIATFPLAGDAPSIWSAALSALSAARRQEGGVVQFASAMVDDARARFALATELRGAIAAGQLRVLYQPQLGLRSGRIESVEALVRWAHPERGLLEPAAFVPLAERDRTIIDIDLAVLRMVLAQCAAWAATGVLVPVAVNMSGRTASDEATAGLVLAALADAKVAAQLLTIEITEQALVADVDAAQHNIARLRRAGVRLSIDDFGSGHASFAYLRDLPVDNVKIDRAFVMGLTSRVEDAAIVRAIITLSHDLGRRVVAEGVNDEETLRALKQAGCDQVQGYLIGRPVDADEVIKLIRDVPVESPAPKARVLVVNGHAPTAGLIERLLTEDGYTTVVVRSVEEARSELFRSRFDVVLLDIALPDGSGLDLARWLRVRWPRTKILIVSASDPAQFSPELERYLHVATPFEPAELRAAVQTLIA